MAQLKERVLATFLQGYPVLAEAKNYHGKWSYDFGVVLRGFQEEYRQTGKREYFDYIQQTMDYFIQEDGSIKNYRFEALNIDYVNNGKLLFLLYEKTGQEKYKLALDQLFAQLEAMPRTPEGGFWHKKIYPEQMWLDGLYMGAPFYAEYLVRFKGGAGLEDVVRQFELCFEHARDPQTGLLYHAWDSAKKQPWADPETGCSPHFWGRSMGWYVMALVDVIELLPVGDYRQRLAKILLAVMDALFKVQDPVAKVWYQVLDEGTRHGNYLEASGSSMIVYGLAKGLVLGVFTEEWQTRLEESYTGLVEEFVLIGNDPGVHLIRNCEVAGLGGADQRDGSFVYYVSEPIVTNDFKGLGAFLQAVIMMEQVERKALHV